MKMMRLDGTEINAVASDLDGTLLGESSFVSEESIRVIHALSEKGLCFIAASGRQYENVVKLFAPIKDEIYFVCENGSVIVRHDEIIHMEMIEEETVYELLDDIRAELGDIVTIVSSEGKVFAEQRHANFVAWTNEVRGQSFRTVESFRQLKQPKNKISVIFPDGVVRAEHIREKYAESLECVDAGGGWLDFNAKGVSKGRALEFLRENVLGGDTRYAAFGDSENDVSMFPLSALSYAMESSPPEVKARASFVCADVTEKLKELHE